ncbi:MAG: hypothetical protein ACRDOK_30365, partial [Streptosporangiaceae bacterium]
MAGRRIFGAEPVVAQVGEQPVGPGATMASPIRRGGRRARHVRCCERTAVPIRRPAQRVPPRALAVGAAAGLTYGP